MYKERTIIAGNTIEKKRYHVPNCMDYTHGCRRKKEMITPDSVQKANARNAERSLRLALNSNFKDEESFLTLTFNDSSLPSTLKEAKQAVTKFLRKLRAESEKQGIDLKFIYVFGYSEGERYHVHMVINLTPESDLLCRLWNLGYIHSRPLNSNGQYRDLAAYMIRNSNEARIQAQSNGESINQRYTPSRNLNKPEQSDVVISEQDVYKEPENIPGFFLEKGYDYQAIAHDGYMCAGETYIGIRKLGL